MSQRVPDEDKDDAINNWELLHAWLLKKGLTVPRITIGELVSEEVKVRSKV